MSPDGARNMLGRHRQARQARARPAAAGAVALIATVTALLISGCAGQGPAGVNSGGQSATRSVASSSATGSGAAEASDRTGRRSTTRTAVHASTRSSARHSHTASPDTSPAGGTPARQAKQRSVGRRPARRASSPPLKAGASHFAGHGSARIGTLRLASGRILTWRTAAAPIEIYTSRGFLLLRSAARHGSVRVLKGTYRDVRVVCSGQWSLHLLPVR